MAQYSIDNGIKALLCFLLFLSFVGFLIFFRKKQTNDSQSSLSKTQMTEDNHSYHKTPSGTSCDSDSRKHENSRQLEKHVLVINQHELIF